MADSKKARMWVRRVAAFQRSGQTRRAWCEARGLSANTLDYWRVRLRDGAPASRRSTRAVKTQTVTKKVVSRCRALVPIVVDAAKHAASSDRSLGDAPPALVEIALPSGARIRVGPGADADWLSTVLCALLAC